MFRNQYDTDVVTWSPQGRIHQIEYAMEAVKQGSAAVGLKSNTHVVLATLKRAPSELSSFQRKIFKIDDHMGIAISGLTADGRIMCRYMRNECLNHRFVFESAMPIARLVRQVADKAQVNTQRSWKRPLGVGLLVGGYDQTGPRLFYNCPSGNFYEYKAMAMGARSQAAKTYLERNFERFPALGQDALVAEALKALSASVTDGELTQRNCTVAVAGKGCALTLLEEDALAPFLDAIKEEADGDAMADEAAAAGGEQPPADGGAGGADAAPMES